MLKEPLLWQLLSEEYRNINEIFVHVLDLNYFYGGKVEKYIPLIWSSWSAVPHINADLRQYILRSLISIASKIDQEPFERWHLSVAKFKEVLLNYFPSKDKFPIIDKLSVILHDEELLKETYFNAFKCSLIIVDLATKVFYSGNIRSKLYADENISFEHLETRAEEQMIYNAPLDFVDIEIKCPIPYLFDRMTRVLDNEYNIEDVERETTLCFLAMNSKTN